MITKAKYFIGGICMICGLSSCSDMLESDSSRQLFDPALDQKTDSVFYAYGIMQAMQELADQYYYQNEMRGDLVSPTSKATTHLRNLASFTADATNKYDSVYLYYKVINNCNYYLAETLKARYTDEQLAVPTFNQNSRSAGMLNWGGGEKFFSPKKCFVPFNVVLGDIYLELGEYEKAATCYYQYLRYEGQLNSSNISVNYNNYMSPSFSRYSPIFKNFTEWPADFNDGKNSSLFNNTPIWENSFTHAATPGDVISYIPMAVNYTMGKTTDIPASYGYNYYGTERTSTVDVNDPMESIFDCPKTEDIQIVPSQAYCDSARRAQYYYYTEQVKVTPFNWIVKNVAVGDARAESICQGVGADSTFVYTYKPSTAYVYLYRNATVWLHLAEAINRMGYPDAAFAVLKNGLHTELPNYRYLEVYLKDAEGNDSLDGDGNKVLDMTQSHLDDKYYLTPESYELLTTKLPFLAQENSEIFRNGAQKSFVGIHMHGAGAVEDLYSTYRYSNVLAAKLADINSKFSLGLTTYTKDDYINAMEDLLCDEYAMEFAFEGTRFSDLRRLALHKNQSGLYGGNFGDKWLSTKLQNNAPGITTQNCYLPYK